MSRGHGLVGFLVTAASLIIGWAPAAASVVWQADPAQGTKSFGQLNLENGSTITVVDDPTYGRVYKSYKPAGSNRGETSHLPGGLHAQEGNLWYIGWRFKVDMAQNQTDNNIFQWKSYPNSTQNWPVVLKHINGTFNLLYHNPKYQSEYPWKGPTVVNRWITVVLCLKVSRDPKVGYIEFWLDGKQQTLSNGATRYPARTLDDGVNDPKWGVYGGPNNLIIDYFCPPKIATTYEEAAPDGTPLALGPEPLIRPLLRENPRSKNFFDAAGRHLTLLTAHPAAGFRLQVTQAKYLQIASPSDGRANH